MRSFGIVFGLGVMTIIAAGAVAAALPLPFLYPFNGACAGSVGPGESQVCDLGQHAYTTAHGYSVTPSQTFGGSIGVRFSPVPGFTPSIVNVHSDFTYGCDFLWGQVECAAHGPALEPYVPYNVSCWASGNPGGQWACSVRTT